MKVRELTGAQLDYWVARAEGWTLKSAAPYNGLLYATAERPSEWRWLDMFKPSTGWAHGGPIIERERIGVAPSGDGSWSSFKVLKNEDACISMSGPDPLTAAMRAYVASKFGDEVEVGASQEN